MRPVSALRRRRRPSYELLYVAGLFWSLGFIVGRFSVHGPVPEWETRTRVLRESRLRPSLSSRTRFQGPPVNGTYEYWPNPVIVVGLPKSGTNSLAAYFRCGGVERVSHHRCANRACGAVIHKNLKQGRKPLAHTGQANVYAQLDVEFDPRKGLPCYFPQIEALEEIHAAHPTSTFLLNTRNVTDWVRSLRAWSGMDRRLMFCDIVGLPAGVGMMDEDLLEFYQSQTRRVKDFVRRHPSHRLVEVVIDSPGAGLILEDAFGINASCWGHENENVHLPDDNELSEEGVVVRD